MICEKCGKTGPAGTRKCNFCGEKMPDVANGSGFEDILSYEGPSPVNSSAETNGTTLKEGYSEEAMQKLIKKSDKIIDHTQKNAMLSLVAIIISVVILIVSLVSSCSIEKAITKGGNEVDNSKASLESIQTEIDEYMQTLDSVKDKETKKELEKIREDVGKLKDSETKKEEGNKNTETEQTEKPGDNGSKDKETDTSDEVSEKKEFKDLLGELVIEETIIKKINADTVSNEEYNKMFEVFKKVKQYAEKRDAKACKDKNISNFVSEVNKCKDIDATDDEFDEEEQDDLEKVYILVDEAKKEKSEA